jgi:mono/diheme cytochrome c family protein
MRINIHNKTISKTLLICLSAIVFATFSGCYNTQTGQVTWGPAVNFKLPAFPETGSHQVLVFSEMHYSPSYRSQETPRILPPNDSVPITGSELITFDLDELKNTQMPESVKANFQLDKAEKIYLNNCAVCHGTTLAGDGPITTLMSARADGSLAYTGTQPVNLNSDRVWELSDGEIFGYITWGGRPGFSSAKREKESPAIMPMFKYLLTEYERWYLVEYLREWHGNNR